MAQNLVANLLGASGKVCQATELAVKTFPFCLDKNLASWYA